MYVFHNTADVADLLKNGALAIGNFDGMHAGHQELIKKANALKDDKLGGILTFSPHPLDILHPKKTFFYLTSDAQKKVLAKELDVDVLIIQHIDKKFLDISHNEFIKNILIRDLKVKNVVVGKDFSFGKKAGGKIEHLQAFDEFKTHVVEDVFLRGRRVSSSWIRDCLREGDVENARHLLKRNFSYRGTVSRGKQQGRLLGFKTANLIPRQGFSLKSGVYISFVRLIEEGICYLSCSNVGVKPTLSKENKVVIEPHIIDYEANLYDKEIEVYFVHRLRDEYRFESRRALQEQVQKDLQQTRQFYETHPHLFFVRH